MAQDGYWSLFWQTGLPQAYLAAREERREERPPAAPEGGPAPGPGPLRAEGTGGAAETGG